MAFHGWTQDAITAAAAKLQLSLATAGLLSVEELVSKSMEYWNQALENQLSSLQEQDAINDNARIVQAFRWRLECVQDLIRANRWHEGMAVGAQQASTTTTQIADIVDITLRHCSNDYSMAERIALGAVYVATEFHMLSDTSEGFGDTWMFLEKLVLDWDRLRSISKSVPFASSDALWTASQVGSAIFGGVYTVVSRPNATFGTNPHDYGRTS